MAIELASANRAQTSAAALATGSRRNDGQPYEQADFYANLGYTTQDPETGENIFVSLPNGLALDTMKAKALGSTERYNNMVSAGNDLMGELQELAQGLEPGEWVTVALEVQILRRKEKIAPAANANPLSAGRPKLQLAKAG